MVVYYFETSITECLCRVRCNNFMFNVLHDNLLAIEISTVGKSLQSFVYVN